jgi:hypothetical protein
MYFSTLEFWSLKIVYYLDIGIWSLVIAPKGGLSISSCNIVFSSPVFWPCKDVTRWAIFE